MSKQGVGWIKLHRKMIDWEWYSDGNTFRVFVHLLFTANYEDSRYRGYSVPRGSVVIGRKALAETLAISEQNVRTALDHLKSTNEITIKSTNRFSVATVVNYEFYQEKDIEPTNKVTVKLTNNQPTTNQQLTTSKEVKNKEVKNIRIVLPFDSEKFIEKWETWKEYKKIEHRFNYKSEISEQSALNDLKKLSGNNEDMAIKIIEQSQANGWKGFVPIKNNVKQNAHTQQTHSEDAYEKLAKQLSNGK